MSRFGKISLLAVALINLADLGSAAAQDNPCEEDPCASTEDPLAEGEGDATGGEDAAAAAEGTDEAAPASAAGSYPVNFLARPLTLPTGIWEAGLDIPMTQGLDLIATRLSGFFGINDKLMVGASYAFFPVFPTFNMMGEEESEFRFGGPFLLHGFYSVLKDEKMELVARANTGYDFGAEDFADLHLAADFRYKIDEKMAVLTGADLSIALAGRSVPTGMGMFDEVNPIDLTIPAAFGYQVNEQIYAEAQTTLMVLNIADSETNVMFADFIPLNLFGRYALDNKLDVGAGILFGDLKYPDDTFGFLLMARYRGGKL